MRKGIALLLMISLALVCAGCGSAPAQTASEPVPAQAPEQAPAETPAPVDPAPVDPPPADPPADQPADPEPVIIF